MEILTKENLVGAKYCSRCNFQGFRFLGKENQVSFLRISSPIQNQMENHQTLGSSQDPTIFQEVCGTTILWTSVANPPAAYLEFKNAPNPKFIQNLS